MKELRSSKCTIGPKMAGARGLWRANGMKDSQFGKPVIAVVNSFTPFVPGHVHLQEIGQEIKAKIEELGCFAAEFNTIAVDDGIAMGHDGMLYSLPSREVIADSGGIRVHPVLPAPSLLLVSSSRDVGAAQPTSLKVLFLRGGCSIHNCRFGV